MKKYVILFLLILPAVFFIGWVILLSLQVKTGQEVRIQIEGFDPRDILSGHYILYQNNQNSVREKTKGTICNELDFYGAKRFYIPEKNAKELDALFRSRRFYWFEVVYACNAGAKPIAKQMLINGVDWRIFLKENK